MNKKRKFDKIARDIKDIKIQGARNIAKAAFAAYSLIPGKKSAQKLLSLRPTEPMMENVLEMAEIKIPKKVILEHFDSAQLEINKAVFKIINQNDIVFTHCHSTNVSHALIYTHKKRKKFQVYNTETRPLFQGRKTAKELKKAGIKVTIFVDSAIALAIEKQNRLDKMYVDKIFLGADAVLDKGVINKIGSGLIAEIAHFHKIPFYIVADSWKFTKSKVPIEQRDLNEVWDNAPKNIKVKNPAFEFIPKKHITGIVTEFGLMKYSEFVRRMSRR